MTTRHPISYSTLDDIIFEGRNRAYGAYLLRKVYNQHLIKALLIGLSLFLLFLSVPIIANSFKPEKITGEPKIEPLPHELTNIKLPPDVLEPTVTPPAVTPPAAPTKEFTTNIVIKPIVQNPKEIPDQGTLSNIEPGTTTTAGNPGGTAVIPGEGTGTGKAEAVAPVEQAIFNYVEQMPTFPGGDAALLKYLGENTKYSELARRNGLEGLVVLSFIVNANGDITDIQVLKKLGGGLDEEAIKVVKSMPKWSPGRNNGMPVNVRFKLPVRFSLR